MINKIKTNLKLLLLIGLSVLFSGCSFLGYSIDTSYDDKTETLKIDTITFENTQKIKIPRKSEIKYNVEEEGYVINNNPVCEKILSKLSII